MHYFYDPVIICNSIRALRLKHNLTIPEMAHILELSQENLQLLESGVLTDEMTVRILYNIHDHFGFLPSELLSKTDQ